MNKSLDPDMPGARLPRTIWYTRCPVPTAAGIAIQKGWLKDTFAAEGIAVSSMRHSQDPKTRESHYTHTLDDSFRQGGNTPALFAPIRPPRTSAANFRPPLIAWATRWWKFMPTMGFPVPRVGPNGRVSTGF